MKLASRINRIKPSPTVATAAKAMAMQASGIEVVSLAQGEPDFDTPDNIKEAAYRAIQKGYTKYTPPAGYDDLKDAIIQKFKRDNSLTYDRSQILVSAGAKIILYNLAQALIEAGDEVIVPSPYWVSYTDIVLLADGAPVVVPTTEQEGFKITPAKLKAALTPRTKAFMINTPCNPTGATYTPEELKALAEVLAGRNILIIADDIYEKFVYDGKTAMSIASLGKEVQDQTIIVNGVSKTYAMTGWRIGYAAGPKDLMGALTKIQTQNVTNATAFCQKASVEALLGSQEAVQKMVIEFDRRRRYIVDRLNRMGGITCSLPPGAFYVFPNISGLFGRRWQGKTLTNSIEVTDFILEEAKVALVAGAGFGDDRYMRLSYATSMKNIETAMNRLEEALKKLQ